MTQPGAAEAVAVQLAAVARDVGLVVTCLRPQPGSGGRIFEVEMWDEDFQLWARARWVTADVVREMIGRYADRQVHLVRSAGRRAVGAGR
ncbi:hypothetical protein AB0F93_03430 [Micromonospora tulbaghiae]|uniref:hypothetical protein n=1 Tax=Micromonospora tulbaghiae TaxID=479978 RepID=UPI003317AE4B